MEMSQKIRGAAIGNGRARRVIDPLRIVASDNNKKPGKGKERADGQKGMIIVVDGGGVAATLTL